MEERIVSVALILEDGLIISLPRPFRHHDIINNLKKHNIKDPGPHKQRFLTNLGRYVTREEGFHIALKYCQIDIPKKTSPQTMLFSEDLW